MRRNSTKMDYQKKLQNYARLRPLGSGEFGVVTLVLDKSNTKQFAMKEIKCNAGVAELIRANIEKECYQNLHHPNIIKYHEHFLSEGDPITYTIVMEYCKEGSLDDKIKIARETKDTFSETRILQWSMQLCRAVEYLHDCPMNIIHRDIKPANILLNKFREVVLTDFGVAKILGDEFNATISLSGTPLYMPPECWDPSLGKLTNKWDMWGVGCVMHKLASLKDPFDGTGIAKFRKNVTQGPHGQLDEKYKRLQPVIDLLLKKKPEERPTAAEILTKMNNLLLMKSSFCDRVAKITKGDMDLEMQQEVVDVAVRAMEKYTAQQNGEIASYMQHEFDKKHGQYWNCVAGSQPFGDRVTYEPERYIHFVINNVNILLYKVQC